MSMVYSAAEQMPEPLALPFWLRIMKEHALFLELGLHFYQLQEVREADAFFGGYRMLEMELEETGQTPELIASALELTELFRDFKLRLLGMALSCSRGGTGNNLPLLVDHIAREADRFIALLRGDRGGMGSDTQAAVAAEVFWLRIMADHLRFIDHLLDPSQRALILQVRGLIERVDPLLDETRDYESMLRADPVRFPALVFLTRQAIDVVTAVRDFKAEATGLLRDCQVLAIAPALLADHVRREADHFLEILERLLPILGPLGDVPPQSLEAEEIHQAIWGGQSRTAMANG